MGAQGLVGYAKQANFSKEDILDITKYTVNIVMKPPVKDIYKEYIMGDHLILLREIAVSVKMDKHTRKEFIRNVKPLMKLKIYQMRVINYWQILSLIIQKNFLFKHILI